MIKNWPHPDPNDLVKLVDEAHLALRKEIVTRRKDASFNAKQTLCDSSRHGEQRFFKALNSATSAVNRVLREA